MENKKRPSWDEYFIEICRVVRTRATCDRGRNGVVVVKDKRILVTGYVGSPPGFSHCDDAGHIIEEVKHDDGSVTKHCVRSTHAEVNAITQAAKQGISLDGGTLYTLLEPCFACAKAIVGAGIKRVVCEKKYHVAEKTRELFAKAGIEHVHLTGEMMVYDEM
jgi:dCMP deaminase